MEYKFTMVNKVIAFFLMLIFLQCCSTSQQNENISFIVAFDGEDSAYYELYIDSNKMFVYDSRFGLIYDIEELYPMAIQEGFSTKDTSRLFNSITDFILRNDSNASNFVFSSLDSTYSSEESFKRGAIRRYLGKSDTSDLEEIYLVDTVYLK